MSVASCHVVALQMIDTGKSMSEVDAVVCSDLFRKAIFDVEVKL